MERWKSVVALTVVGALVAAPAWAQSSTTPSSDKGTTSGGSSMQKDKSSTGTSGTTSGGGSGSMSGTTTGAGGTGTGEMKAGKSGAMKTAKGGAKKEQVRAAQQALKDKGHDPGMVDGVMGPKTKQALRDFQKKEGLKESGQLDSETMAKLDIKTSAAGGASPSASPATGSGAGQKQ